jgi:hypothetical protein
VFGRRQTMTKTQSELMRDEFGEGFDHLRMAAAHAAGTAAGLIAPRLDSMRERLEPAFEKSMEKSKDKARASARRANTIARRATGKKKKETRMAKRWPMVVGGLMIAGVAAGAAGALLSRRRQKRWNEYGTTTSFRDDTRNLTDSARATASVAETAKDKAGDVLGQMKNATDTKPTTTTASTSSTTSAPSTSTPSPHATGSSTRTGEFSSGETYRSSSSTGTSSRNGRP